jgi:hypothetical protein
LWRLLTSPRDFGEITPAMPAGVTDMLEAFQTRDRKGTLRLSRGSPHTLWAACRNRDADLLRLGRSKPLVRSCIRGRLCTGIDLWLSTRRVALRGCRGNLGRRGRTPMAKTFATIKLTHYPNFEIRRRTYARPQLAQCRATGGSPHSDAHRPWTRLG